MPKLPPRSARESETAVVLRIREALAANRWGLLWRNNVGKLRDERGRLVSYGLGVGSADLVGLQSVHLSCPSCGTKLPPIGRFVGLEVKAPVNPEPLSDEQRAWLQVVADKGGTTGVVHSVDEALAVVAQAHTW